MPVQYPAALDSFTNPTASDTLGGVPHHQQHADANDAVEALERKVGVDGSADAASLDYLVKNPLAVDPGHRHTAAAITNFAAAVQAVANVTSVFGRTGAVNEVIKSYRINKRRDAEQAAAVAANSSFSF